jgi:hypothetical protein
MSGNPRFGGASSGPGLEPSASPSVGEAISSGTEVGAHRPTSGRGGEDKTSTAVAPTSASRGVHTTHRPSAQTHPSTHSDSFHPHSHDQDPHAKQYVPQQRILMHGFQLQQPQAALTPQTGAWPTTSMSQPAPFAPFAPFSLLPGASPGVGTVQGDSKGTVHAIAPVLQPPQGFNQRPPSSSQLPPQLHRRANPGDMVASSSATVSQPFAFHGLVGQPQALAPFHPVAPSERPFAQHSIGTIRDNASAHPPPAAAAAAWNPPAPLTFVGLPTGQSSITPASAPPVSQMNKLSSNRVVPAPDLQLHSRCEWA